jgi:hypothetical protein
LNRLGLDVSCRLQEHDAVRRAPALLRVAGRIGLIMGHHKLERPRYFVVETTRQLPFRSDFEELSRSEA